MYIDMHTYETSRQLSHLIHGVRRLYNQICRTRLRIFSTHRAGSGVASAAGVHMYIDVNDIVPCPPHSSGGHVHRVTSWGCGSQQ